MEEIKLKLKEELEFKKAKMQKKSIEELADVLELVHAALDVYNLSFHELERVRLAKKEKKRGFSEEIYFLKVEDD